MRYDRKIKYLDYLENGARVRGGGFLKLETAGDSFRMELTIQGVRCAKGQSAGVILCGGGREAELGQISLEDGRGEMRQTCHVSGGIGATGIGCAELDGIRVLLGEGREIVCRWEAAEARETSGVSEAAEARGASEPRTAAGARGASEPPGREPVQPIARGRDVRKADAQTGAQTQPAEQARFAAPWDPAGKRTEVTPLLENKWRQLCAIYPHIRPFQDQREYLSIGPEDFVLFSTASYKTAGNSFMLHGYYHYRHLILAREERRGEAVYYVGVPGTYHDREKQVALMFGFESFECAQEPAQSEDFGYYMMRVEL